MILLSFAAGQKFWEWWTPTSKKPKILIPGELILIVLAGLAQYIGKLNARFKVPVIRTIPQSKHVECVNRRR